MDKPRHPQVIRPWKIQQTKQAKFSAPTMGDPRHLHSSKLELHWKTKKNATE